ncbi:MAG: cell division protein FtsZ, partial [Campylobacterales bacterium]
MEAFTIEESSNTNGARIIAVGVGGGGGNMIGHMINEGINGIEMIMINTDAQVLSEAVNATKIQIGSKLTKGLGAGMK